jgi:hypothetical protein
MCRFSCKIRLVSLLHLRRSGESRKAFPAARAARELGSGPVEHLLFEIFIALLRVLEIVLEIVLRRLSFAHAVEIKLDVAVPD